MRRSLSTWLPLALGGVALFVTFALTAPLQEGRSVGLSGPLNRAPELIPIEIFSVHVADLSCGVDGPLVSRRSNHLHCSVAMRPQIKVKAKPIGLTVRSKDIDIQMSCSTSTKTNLDSSISTDCDFYPRRSGDGTFVVLASLQDESGTSYEFPFDLPVEFDAGFWDIAFWKWPFLLFGALSLAYWFAVRIEKSHAEKSESIQHRIAEAETKAEQAPDKAKFAWDVARVKLEAYFDRNLIQVNQIFWLAVIVMLVGFGFILWGIVLSISQPKITPTSLIAGVSGIITQFVGATFIAIYRSTMTQANQFMAVLERINTVGMAVQVLDSIPDENHELKNATRAEIIALLLRANLSSAAAGDGWSPKTSAKPKT